MAAEKEAEARAKAKAVAKAAAEAVAEAATQAAAKAAAEAAVEAAAEAATQAAAEATAEENESPPQPYRCAYSACMAAGRQAISCASGWTACADGVHGAGWRTSAFWTDHTSSSCPETPRRPGVG